MRLVGVTGILLSCSTIAHASPLDPIPARVIVSYPEGGGIRLGAGLSSTTQDPTERYCITGGRGSHPLNSNGINFQQVIDNSSLSDSLSISAKARYQGLRASATYTHTTVLRESDTNIAVSGFFDDREEFVSADPSLPRLGSSGTTPFFALTQEQAQAGLRVADVRNFGGTADDPPSVGVDGGPKFYAAPELNETIGLTNAARRTLRTRGLEAFRVECGDYFVAGIIHGGKFDGLLTASNTSRDERTAISASLKGSYSFGSFSVSTSRVVQSLRSNDRLDLKLRSEGSGPVANPIGVEEFVNFVKQFPLSVPASARPIRIVLQSYASLADYRRYSQDLPPSIDRVVDQYLRLEHLRRNAAQMDDQPATVVFLGRITQRSLREHADAMSTKQTRLSEALRVCENDIDNCVFPDGVPTNDYAARLEMPMTAIEFPWARRAAVLHAQLQNRRNAIASTPATRIRCSGGVPGLRCRPVPNPRYQELRSAIAQGERCVGWLDPSLVALYIHDRVERWVQDVWRTRAESSDRVRAELSYAQIDQMLRAEFAKENLPYAERPVPIACNWPA